MRIGADARARAQRVRQHGWQILQCGVGAGLAWVAAQALLGHPQPIFASVAAVLGLGISYGQRLRRVVEVVVGVAVGVLVGDLVVHLAGNGAWQLVLVVVLGMSVAVFLRAGTVMVNQSAVQGLFVATVLPGSVDVLDRWLDALTGGVVALVLAAIVPATPLRRPRDLASRLLAELADLLWEAATAARAGDAERAHDALAHARGTQARLDALRAAATEGLDVLRVSPLRRRQAAAVRAVARLAEPLDRAVRNVRVLARRLSVATERGEDVPPQLLDLLDHLAAAALRLSEDVQRGLPRSGAVDALTEAGRASARVPRSSLSADAVLAQARSTAVDLLEVAGLDEEQARARVPVPDQAPPPPPARSRPRPDDA
ncbi:aromatic acid exporter family protein [Quadrisphaera sp. DSM 44207]|uniref:FUSC family protein n=1 Tax=Quadrisphaera sp. DSM 44207 TaxID=1881057 RepID=UPI000882883B|nr:FUSC family protein [Quadrisphaera sp. DSM 44207]SDQ45651.1 Uncharacterized membrane protein YgaE, UPF0421/DUF939 family [Quadrisphaera sp. DSM 44207]